MSNDEAAAPAYPPGPLPPKDDVLREMRVIFATVGPENLTMKILRAGLAEAFKRDLKEHTPTLSDYVNEVMVEPQIKELLQKERFAAPPVNLPPLKRTAVISSNAMTVPRDFIAPARRHQQLSELEQHEGNQPPKQEAQPASEPKRRPRVDDEEGAIENNVPKPQADQ